MKKWLITYNAWDHRSSNPRLHTQTTGTAVSTIHPFYWAPDFLARNPSWEGVNILFAIQEP